MKIQTSVRRQQSWRLRTRAESVGQRPTNLAPYQTRTCAHCGRHTTFVLEDAAGGWYSCIECGRYA
jgi:PHP family Zn ribbon phosphoesterase